jgi:glycosyltransferase involved in cell wall biosynthesis
VSDAQRAADGARDVPERVAAPPVVEPVASGAAATLTRLRPPPTRDVPTVSVIVTTYNRPTSLLRVLDALAAQDTHDFEIVVADDGSRDATRDAIAAWAERSPVPIAHVWHPDTGFRVAAIRNRGLAVARAPYVIFLDGDCVPPTWFVAAHRALAEPGWFLAGNRLLLSRRLTERVEAEQRPIHRDGFATWLARRLTGGINRVLPLIRRPDGEWRKRAAHAWTRPKSCNLSGWRADFERVNGYDERYEGWGREDSDLVIRLMHAGVLQKSARFAAPVFHLWHREADRSKLRDNDARLEALLASKRVRAEQGLAEARANGQSPNP